MPDRLQLPDQNPSIEPDARSPDNALANATVGWCPAGVRAADVLRLQRSVGNRSTVRLLARSGRLLQRSPTWHQQRAAEIHAAIKQAEQSPDAWPAAYDVYNGLSNDDQIKVYRLLSAGDRKALEDNLDKTTGDRARMYQAIQKAKAGAGAAGADASAGDWWREKTEELHWAIRCSKFVNYAEEEDDAGQGRSRGAFWILSNHNDAARRRLMTLLDAESLDALLRHAGEAGEIPGAADIVAYATSARASRPQRARQASVAVGDEQLGAGAVSLASAGQLVIRGKRVASGPLVIGGVTLSAGANVVAITGGTLMAVGAPGAPTPAVPAGSPVVDAAARARQIENALKSISELQKSLDASRAAKDAAEAARLAEEAATAAQRARLLSAAGRGGLFVLLTVVVAGTIIVVAAAISGYQDRGELPEGGLDDLPSDPDAPQPAQAPGAAVPAPATDPDALNPAVAPGADGSGPALAPGKGPPAPAAAPGVSDEELELKVPDPVKVTRPQQDWWPEISAVAPDWAQKGAHIKINDIELAVRPAGPGIALPPVFSRDVGTEDTAGAQRAATDAIHELGFRQRLFNACVRAIQLLHKGSDMARARAGELRHLLRELERLGLQ